jgi:REP element-mobilizing transposase RayT
MFPPFQPIVLRRDVVDEDDRFYRRRLPHLRCNGAVYFVTWRLAEHQQPLTAIERDCVAGALKHFAGERYELFGYVVMDDHVHVVLGPLHGERLERLVHSWKSYCAHRIRRPGQRPLWQREYFDRVLRDQHELDGFVQYILQNPGTRWPGVTDYPWVWCREDLLA